MTTKCQEVALTLLDEVDAACQECGASYFLSGEYSCAAYRGGSFLSASAAPSILMTLPDIAKLMAALEKKAAPNRVFESLASNEELDTLSFYYCATDTLFLKLSEVSKRKTAGISVRIEPLRGEFDSAAYLAGLACEGRWLFDNKKRKEKPQVEADGWFKERAVRKALEKLRELSKTDKRAYARHVLDSVVKGQRKVSYGQALFTENSKGVRKEYPAGLFDSPTRIELEGHSYLMAADREAFLDVLYEGDWRERKYNSEEFGNYTLMCVDLPYEVYLKRVADEGVPMITQQDLSAVKRLKRQDKPLAARTAGAWAAAHRSGMRFDLAAELLPRKEEICALHESGAYDELAKVLAHYDECARKLKGMGLGLCFDEDILVCYLDLLRSRGEGRLVDEINAIVPDCDREPMQLP